MRIIATSTQSIDDIDPDFSSFLAESQIAYVPRQKKSLDKIKAENQASAVIVWEATGPVMYLNGSKFFFHPSMAKVRISAFRKDGVLDPLIQACELKEDDYFLDCTLGLGADSIVASYFTPRGRVVGVESSIAVSYIVKWGMQLYKSNMPWLQEAIQRIKVINQEHNQYLIGLDDNSFDIVYFDPMFRIPLMKSQAISPLRDAANSAALSEEAVLQACRVARKKVVIKERKGSSEFERLKCTDIYGSSNNKIAYGIISV
ncbi:protein-l-isod(d-d) o-methyltransferase [hydrocarbon metagenome]|uniref:Protein-l-isod(D-d) o-methyltransferase n=1 Tax=hydrocarbon metagenome TaxID=938273 RepID=A0A0W8E8A5_9ZZZZ